MEKEIQSILSNLEYLYKKIYLIILINFLVLVAVFYYVNNREIHFKALATIKSGINAQIFEGQVQFIRNDVIYEEFVYLITNKKIVYENLIKIIKDSNMYESDIDSVAHQLSRSLTYNTTKDDQLPFSGKSIFISLTHNNQENLLFLLHNLITNLVKEYKNKLEKKFIIYEDKYEKEIEMNDLILTNLSEYIISLTKDDSRDLIDEPTFFSSEGEENDQSVFSKFAELSLQKQFLDKTLGSREITKQQLVKEYLDLIEKKQNLTVTLNTLKSFADIEFAQYTPVFYTPLDTKVRSNEIRPILLGTIVIILTTFLSIIFFLLLRLFSLARKN